MLVCSGCGGRARKIEEVRERTVRDLPWRKYQAIVVVEFYRVRCTQCGLKVERVPQLPGKAPFSKDFEEEVGLACEAASARQVARRFQLAASTVRSRLLAQKRSIRINLKRQKAGHPVLIRNLDLPRTHQCSS